MNVECTVGRVWLVSHHWCRFTQVGNMPKPASRKKGICPLGRYSRFPATVHRRILDLEAF